MMPLFLLSFVEFGRVSIFHLKDMTEIKKMCTFITFVIEWNHFSNDLHSVIFVSNLSGENLKYKMF